MNETLIMFLDAYKRFGSFIFGGFDQLFQSLIVVISVDYITCLCKAVYKRNVNNSYVLKEIIKKFGYLLIVILATLLDRVVGDGRMSFRTLVIYFFISNTSMSILENWGIIGLPLPKKLCEVFEKIKSE